MSDGPSDELLRGIEAIAAEVDVLDATAAEVDSLGKLGARRQRLLIEVDVAGVLAVDDALRARLGSLGLVKLAGYHDAALAMREYFRSPHRERLMRSPPPESVLESNVSLDWFRSPSGYVPDGVPADAWLALCERNFIDPMPSKAGARFVRLEHRIHKLMYRVEIGPGSRLWRALPG